MISQVFREFIDSHRTGLGIIELPTSIGKTYSTFECVAQYAADWEQHLMTHKRNDPYRQIIIVTPLKKNLQNGIQVVSNEEGETFQGLRRAYKECGRLDKYDQEVLFLDSLTEILKSNMSLLRGNTIPLYIQRIPCYKDLISKIQLLMQSEIIQQDQELLKVVTRDANKLYFELRKGIVPAYKRQERRDEKLTLSDLAERIGWDWIYKLYPDLRIRKSKVLLMSFKKLLDGRVYEKPSCAFVSRQFLKNKVVIIDEFDSTKATIKDSLAEEQSEYHVDFLQLFASIYSGSKTQWASDSFLNIDHSLGDKYNNLEKVLESADKRRTDYLLDCAYQTDGDLRDSSRTFIFTDNATRTISKTSSGISVICHKTEEGRVALKLCRSEERQPGDFFLEGTIRWVTGFLRRFANYVMFIATRYQQQENAANRDTADPELSVEDAFRSFLYKFSISRNEVVPNPQTKLLMSMADASAMASKRRNKVRQGYDYYLDGFRYYSMEDGQHHNDNTIISMVDIPETAEGKLSKMATYSLVLGMSATAAIPSVTGNYNLDWICDSIDDYTDVVDEYPELRQEVDEILAKRYQPYEDGNIMICTHVLKNDKLAQESTNLYGAARGVPCNALAGIEKLSAIKIEKYIKDSILFVEPKQRPYVTLRYYNLMQVMHDFASRSYMQSLLYLGSKKAEGNIDERPNGRRTFDQWIINKMVQAVNYSLKLNDDEKIGVAFIYSNAFDKTMQEIRERLSDIDADGKPKHPERLVIISAYESVGIGQNMQYPAPEKYLQHLVRLTPRGEEKADTYKDKDIDGIYLGDITRLIAQFGDKKLTEKDLILNIIQAEELNAAWEITPEEKEANIKDAFNHLDESFPKTNALKNCESIRSERTRKVIQAVGRIGRSNQRCKEIHVYIDSTVFENLHKPTLERRFSSPEIKEIIRIFDENCHPILYDEQITILNRAAKISDDTSEFVNRRRTAAEHEGEWDTGIMQWWRDLRETVMKLPTASEEDYTTNPIVHSYYIDNYGRPVNRYLFSVNNRYYEHQHVWFGDENTFRNTVNTDRARCPYKKPGTDELFILTMSEENARLDTLLRYPGLREWWLSQGYAEHFNPNKYIVCPFLYTEILKGAYGETAGRFIYERETGLHLKEIDDPKKFEKSDYEIVERPDEYIDFKHYYSSSAKDGGKEYEKALWKLNNMSGKRMYIMNLIKAGADSKIEQAEQLYDGRIVVLPWMISESGQVNPDIRKTLLL